MVLGALLFLAGFMPGGTLQAASPPGLERLFATAAQRAQLDRMRREGVGSMAQDETTAGTGEVSRMIINGIVVGSDGRRMVWVNGRLLPDRAVLGRTGARLRLVSNGRVAVKPSGQQRAILVKPGQVLELDSGKVQEAYEPGAGQGAAGQGDHGGR